MDRRLIRTAAWVLVAVGLGLCVWEGLRRPRGDNGVEAPRPLAANAAARSLLLITVDTTRPDRLEPYGSDSVETPNLAALAASGVTFEHAYSVAPITLVAHTSIMTGLEPLHHGVRNNGLHYVAAELDTLAERLSKSGWSTAAFVSAAVLDRRYGLDQGFGVYDDDLSAGRERHPRMVADRPASATVMAARTWLDGLAADRPYFLWVHFYDPHAAYSPPPPWRDDYRGRLYDGEIAYMDDQIGRLLAHPRVDETTLISVIGDHGESLGEHGELTHALLAFDSTLHVPWILRVPRGPRGMRVRPTVGQVDLVPTVLDFLSQPIPEKADGMSLRPLIEGRPFAETERALYSETFLPFYTYGWAELKVLRRGRFKWIGGPEPKLFDTRLDPHELSDLKVQEPGLAHDLARDLAEHVAGADKGVTELDLDSEARERLRSLGYLAVGSRPAALEQKRPDPQAMIDLHTSLERARFLARDRLFAAAQRELEKVLDRDPKNLAALMDLAEVLADQGLYEQAVARLETAISLDPGYAPTSLRLAGIEAQRGHLERALELTEVALAIDPRLVDASLRRAAYLTRLQRRDESRQVLLDVLAENPESPPANVLFARLVELPEDPLAAEQRVRRALERDPFLVSGWQLLGELLEATSRAQEARDAWRRGLEIRPDDPELHLRLGSALAQIGGSFAAEAEAHLREARRLSTEGRPALEVTLGALLADQGRLDEALELYDGVLATHPEEPAARNNRAVALYRTGRLDEAIAELERLVEHYPRHADAHNNLAAMALDQGRPAEAEKHAHRTLELAPKMAEAWNNLGLARSAQGDAVSARRHFEHALELAPSYWQAVLNLGLLLASEAKDRETAEEAAGLLQTLISERPQLAQAHLELGHLFAELLDDPSRARLHYNAFLRAVPSGPEATEVRRRLAELGP